MQNLDIKKGSLKRIGDSGFELRLDIENKEKALEDIALFYEGMVRRNSEGSHERERKYTYARLSKKNYAILTNDEKLSDIFEGERPPFDLTVVTPSGSICLNANKKDFYFVMQTKEPGFITDIIRFFYNAEIGIEMLNDH